MGTIESAISWMEATAKDDSHGYDQTYRWGEKGDYDCSAAVITAWQKAGVDVRGAGAGYTGNMYSAFAKCGFKDVTNSVNLHNGTGLRRGDVLLNHVHHTAMYCGGGCEVEASINERGGAKGGCHGDQTGREFLIRSYRNYPWDCVLRYPEQANLHWVDSAAGWWYDLGNGTYPANKWMQINNVWYWFNSYGYASHDRWEHLKGYWYYFDSSCAMVTGWRFVRGYWYYLNPNDGSMMTGWLKLKDSWFFLDPKNGDMKTSWQEINGYTYYFDENGYMKKGWLQEKGKWFYFANLDKGYKDGAMVKDGWILYKNAWYHLGSDGVMDADKQIEFDFDRNGAAEEIKA